MTNWYFFLIFFPNIGIDICNVKTYFLTNNKKKTTTKNNNKKQDAQGPWLAHLSGTPLHICGRHATVPVMPQQLIKIVEVFRNEMVRSQRSILDPHLNKLVNLISPSLFTNNQLQSFFGSEGDLLVCLFLPYMAMAIMLVKEARPLEQTQLPFSRRL